MRIAVAGGTGLIGGQLADILRASGYTVLPLSPSTGIDTTSGEGLGQALEGVDVLVDVTKPHTYDPGDVAEFYRRSTGNLVRVAATVGIAHYLTLSAVGIDRVPGSPFYRSKLVQESIVAGSGIPYTHLRSTQFFEFAGAIADAATSDGRVRLPEALVSPASSVEVAAFVARRCLDAPGGGVVEFGGPEDLRLTAFVGAVLAHDGDPRSVVGDAAARYFGGLLGERALLPGDAAERGRSTLAAWLASGAAGL
jgi:uncharacterized protein YbjT (DUF2867 family)